MTVQFGFTEGLISKRLSNVMVKSRPRTSEDFNASFGIQSRVQIYIETKKTTSKMTPNHRSSPEKYGEGKCHLVPTRAGKLITTSLAYFNYLTASPELNLNEL